MHIHFYCFLNDTATTEIYTLSLHDALPISVVVQQLEARRYGAVASDWDTGLDREVGALRRAVRGLREAIYDLRPGEGTSFRSEEHTSELQSRQYLVCRLLLEKKKKNILLLL